MRPSSNDANLPITKSFCFPIMIFLHTLKIKHEYLRSCAYICLSLSSPSSGYLSIKSQSIEILVLTSWIPASKNCKKLKFIKIKLWTLNKQNRFENTLRY